MTRMHSQSYFCSFVFYNKISLLKIEEAENDNEINWRNFAPGGL